MKLIITEKPKVAEKMASALSDGKIEKKKGKGQASYFLFKRGGEDMAVTPAVGHLYTLTEKQKGSSYPTFDIEWRPSYDVEKDSGYTKGYVQTIEMLAKNADEIIVACDYDIEGSLIGYNALRFAGKRDASGGKRMKFSALTKGDLVNAYEERSELDLENALAGESRHMLDWFYGINLSRALMKAIRTTGRFQVMSIGRVQGPALKILADKERAIRAFVPTPYWELICTIDKVQFKHEKGKFENRDEASSTLEQSKNPPHQIKSIVKKPFQQMPNPPFDLTSLQVEAYRQFKFAPTQTQSLAQSLYEASMISYPRTSSQKLPEKLNFPKIIKELSANHSYTSLCHALISQKLFKPMEGKKEDPAHPAIHPTGQGGSVGEREKKLYDLIVRRFLSCFAPPSMRESQKVVALCNNQNFETSGSRTLTPGWFEFYKPYVKLEEVTLPAWKEGQAVNATDFQMLDKETQPPKRFTPASVISELEDRNLGTKATRATVIDTLFKRGYLRGTSSIEVSEFGLSVCTVMEKYAPEILDEELTRNIEMEMDAIQQKQIQPQVVIEDGKKILITTLDKFKLNEKNVGSDLSGALNEAKAEASKMGPCPKCGGELRKIFSHAKKQFVGCSNYPTCSQTYPLPQMALNEPTGKICEACHTPMIKVIRRGRRPFEMCIDPACPTKANWGNYKNSANAGAGQAGTATANANAGRGQPANAGAGQLSDNSLQSGQAMPAFRKPLFAKTREEQIKSGQMKPDASDAISAKPAIAKSKEGQIRSGQMKPGADIFSKPAATLKSSAQKPASKSKKPPEKKSGAKKTK